MMQKLPLNRFLQSKAEIEQCTQWIKDNNLVNHAISAKDWDIRMITPYIEKHFDIADFGCIGSHILDNAAKLNTNGLRYGIDLMFKPEDIDDSSGSWNNLNTPKVAGCKFFQGDLMNTPFENGLFDIITVLSVIEHNVNFTSFAKEVSRLLKQGGKLYVTTDYWDPKPNTDAIKLYDLNWNILDKNDVLSLVSACKNEGLEITGDIDWTINEAVINPNYCSPANVEYTFGIFEFVKI